MFDTHLPDDRVIASFRRRQVRHYVLAVAFFLYAFSVFHADSVSVERTGAWMLGGLFVYGALMFLNWRCPKCGANLGRGLTATSCPRCYTPFHKAAAST